MKNLTSIAEHSDWLEKSPYLNNRKWELHRQRVSFGKQPLAKWMFVPCDEDGNVLEESGMFKLLGEVDNDLEQQRYQQAKERCLFEGFAVKDGLSICEENSILHIFWNYDGIWRISKGLKTIEDLSLYKLQLTPTALKKIGL